MSFLSHLPKHLRSQIESVTKSQPSSLPVFEALYNHLNLKSINSNQISSPDEKRRKLPNKNNDNSRTEIIFSLPAISFTSPFRKKLQLFITSTNNFLLVKNASLISTDNKFINIDDLNNDNKSIELLIPDFWTGLNDLFILPIPDKNTQFHIIFNFLNKELDPIVANIPIETLSSFSVIENLQKLHKTIKIENPFMGNNNDSDKQFYVQTHNGTKEGYLYFIKNYIVFGMKKPIIIVNLLEIDEISYSSITRLTFNINIKLNDKFENKTYEFSMIDHDEFSIIDNYIKENKINDKSLSDELKAKSQLKNSNFGNHENNEKTGNSQLQVSINDVINDVDMEDDEDDADFDIKGDESNSDSNTDEDDEESSMDGSEAEEEQ